MKNIILIFIFILPIWAFGQDYRVIDWKTDVLNVQTVGVDTFKFDAEPKDYNDAGAITREIGNYFIDYVARCFKIIDSDATTITVVDLEHINLAPQSNKIGRVYQSIVDADSIFKSIGGVDISVLDDLSKWKDVARNNELFGRKIKELDRRDTTGIYHINRQLLDSISPEDTTNWNKYLIETDTSGILDKDNFFWSANKKYELITPHIGGGTGDNVYMTNVNSDISGYKKTSYTNDMGITSFSAIASADTVLVQQFLFDGQLSTSILDAGGWIVRTYCKVSSIAGVSKFKYEFFVYDDADSTIFSFYSNEINNTAFQYNEYTSFQSAFNLGKSTYRLGVRVYFLTTSPANITGTFRVGDGETSYINTPIALRHIRIRNPNEDPNVQHMTADDQNAINQYKKDSASYLTSFTETDPTVSAWAKAATKPTYTKSEVGLSNVDNTSDANKPISTATQTALNNLVPFSGADRDVDLGANSISTDTVKIDGVPLLLNTFKQGNLGGASNIFYSTGASSQPASGSVNQVIGGNSLSVNYLPKWNGSKFVNSEIYELSGKFGIGTTNPEGVLDIPGYIYLSSIKAGAIEFQSYALNNSWIGENTFFDGGAHIYRNNGYASQIYFLNGNIDFKTSISGMKGTVPSFESRLFIKNDNGNVGINKTDPSERLDVNGNLIADVLKSRVPTGTPPLIVASSTKVDSLNVGLLDGKKASDFQLKSDTLTFDATKKDLQDSSAAIRALANTKAVVSGTDNYIMKKTGDNTLGNSSITDNGSLVSSTLPIRSLVGFSGIGSNQVLLYGQNTSGALDEKYWFPISFNGNTMVSYISNDAVSVASVISQTKRVGNTIESTCYPNGVFGFGTTSPAARIHSESTTTQARLGYDANKYTDLTTNSAGTFNITPSGGFTSFSGGISATAYSKFSGQVEMTGLDVNLGASTVLRKNGFDIFTAPITMGACGSAGQVLTSTGINSAPTWTTPATGSGSGITSIGIQVPTGLTVSPASLTANGTFTFGLQSGYSIPTTANQTNWSTAYSQRLISVSASYPLYLSLTNNVLTGYLHQRLVDFANANQSTGYLYWNGSSYSYQAATTTYTLPTATDNVLGGVKVATDDGGLYMSGGFLLQKDNVLTTRTPEVSDYIAFYDNSATAQGKMTLSTLGSLIGGSGGGMVYPGAGIPVSTGSAWGTSKTAPSGAIVGTTDSQALTNKSVNGVTLSTGAGATNFLAGDGTYKAVSGGVGTSTSGQLLYNNSGSVGGIGLYNFDSLLVDLDYNGLKAERIIASFDNPQYTVKGENITFGNNWRSIVGGSSGLQNGEMGSAFISSIGSSIDVNHAWNWFIASNNFTNMLLSGTIQLTSYNITDGTYNFKTYNVVIKRLGTTISYLSKTEISSVGTDTTALSNTISANSSYGYYTTALYIDRNTSKQHNIRMIFTGSIMPLIKI